MRSRSNASLRLVVVAGVSISAFTQAHAGNIGGETESSTASAPPLAKHPLSRDDTDVTKTYGIAELSSSFIITMTAKAFPTYNFVFAGAPSGPGSHFTPIDDSAFEISTYTPWVVNSPDLESNGGTTGRDEPGRRRREHPHRLHPDGVGPDDGQFPSGL